MKTKTESKKETKKTSKGSAGEKHSGEKKPEAPPRHPEITAPQAGPSPETLTREAALRKELLRQRSVILGEAKKEIGRIISGENRQIVETALDDGDWSVVDLSEDISLKQLSTHRENLAKIDEALRKLREGTYGICEECGEEIDIERLKVMPFAIYCREDQEKKEIMEALEREAGM